MDLGVGNMGSCAGQHFTIKYYIKFFDTYSTISKIAMIKS